jgi:hypothetical protein
MIDYMDMDFKTGNSKALPTEAPKKGLFAKIADNI